MTRRLCARRRALGYSLVGALLALGAAASAPSFASGRPGAARAVSATPLVTPGGYDAHLGDRLFTAVQVGSSGARVTQLNIDFRHGRCSDGPIPLQVAVVLRPHAAISAGRTFSVRYVFRHPTATNRRGQRVPGTAVLTLKAQFSGSSVSGVVHDTFHGTTLRCASGPVPFTADLAGTGSAPLQTRYAITGRYTAIDPIGQPAVLTVFTPWNIIDGFTITVRKSDCSPTLRVLSDTRWTYNPLLINGHSFRSVGTVRGHGHGLVTFDHVSLTGTLHPAAGTPATYTASVNFIDTARVYKNGRYVGRCTTGVYRLRLTGHSHPEMP